MVCPKCGSGNVSVQNVTDTQLKTKHHGFFWWVLIGWWWIPLKWIFFTVPALIFKLFRPKRYKLKQKHSTVCICQNCAHRWNA